MIKIKNTLFVILFFTFLFANSQEEKKENPFSFKWDNGFKLESADKSFKVKFGGRIMVDHGFFSQDSDLDVNHGELTIKNGTEFRRARFFTSGTIYNNVEFKLQLDFSGGVTTFKDAYIGIKGIPVVGNLRVGHVKEPFRLEALTSSKYITFLERALPIDATQERNNGILLFNEFLNKKLGLQAGLFRNSDKFGNDKSANDDYAFTTRATTLAYDNKEKKQYLHLGAGFSYRKTDTREFSYSSRPEAHLGEKYISTGTIEDVDNIKLINFETAFVTGPFAIQGEYLTTNVKTGNISPVDTYKFSSYYGQISYFLTGEHKKLKGSYAGFNRVKPIQNFDGKKNGIGAWEVALRYSNSDLNSEDIFGGEQTDITLGLNWYLNPVTRVMLNNVFVDVKDKGKANVFEIRFQIDF